MPRLSRFVLAILAFTAGATVGGSANARAQQQERGLMDRIQHPDMSLAYHPAEKSFGGTSGSAPWKKKASVRPFLFDRRASVKSYDAKRLDESRRFSSGAFANRNRVAATNSTAAGVNRGFATRDVAVVEARDARKALPVRGARIPTFTAVGKRQDTLDEQQRAHPMTIDEVRELLNKSK